MPPNKASKSGDAFSPKVTKSRSTKYVLCFIKLTLISCITQAVTFVIHFRIFSSEMTVFMILMDVITTENLGDGSLKGMSAPF